MRITTRTGARMAALGAGLAIAAAVTAATASAGTVARTAPPATAGPACRAPALSLHLAGTDTGVGSTALTVAITNHSAAACWLRGYPSLGLVRGDGATMPGTFERGRGSWFAGLSPAPVRLAPRGQASFFITYRDFDPATGRVGPAAAALRAGLPGISTRFLVPARFAPYGPISVSPVRPGARKA